MDFGWGTWAAIIVAVVVVVLFLGPGMWSSSTEFLGTALWRRWREHRQAAEGRRRGGPTRDDQASR